MTQTYLTSGELSGRIKYDARTIREQLIDSVLLEGRHYFRPFGGRKILFIWEHIEEDMQAGIPDGQRTSIPMANGSKCDAADQRSDPNLPDRGKGGPLRGIPMANGAPCHG